jgi:transketolase
MEGEARESLASIPGFAQKGQLAPYVLIISDNNTKLSGRIDKDSFSMEPTFQSLSAFGWEVIELKEGHNLQKCLEILETAIETARNNPKKPVAIHARTIKGYGTKKTAESSSGAHGFPLKSAEELNAFISEIYEGAAFPSEFTIWCEELQKLLCLKKKFRLVFPMP